MPDLHGHLVLAVAPLRLELGVLDLIVLAGILAGQHDLLILPGAIDGHDSPVGDGDGDAEEGDEEPVGVEPAAVDEGDEPLDDPWDAEDEPGERDVGEGPVALSGQRRVLDRRDVRHSHHLCEEEVGGVKQNRNSFNSIYSSASSRAYSRADPRVCRCLCRARLILLRGL